MFLEISNWVVNYLDGLSIIVGFIAFIPIVWTWYSLTLGQARKERRWAKNALASLKDKEHGILIIDLLPNTDVRIQVEKYARNNEQLKEIEKDKIICINHEKHATPETLTILSKQLQQAHRNIQQQGIDVVHLFFAGPAIAATLIGVEFANSLPVILYHKDKSSAHYTIFGLMNRRYIE